tara:strand:+ start:7338 stop:8015 length:678 start_codon:yes stop_codon:yes gene_type:complete
MTPEAVNAYFTPLDYGLYLLAVFFIMVILLQWKWTKVCRNNVLVLVVKSDGSADQVLAPKEGGSVTLRSPKSNTTRLWPINKLSSIDMTYPGVGFVPDFMQKKIKMVIVDEDDWEALINRNPNKEMIASPAVLGNLMHEKITEAVITVNKEMMDSLAGLIKRMNNMVNPVIVYVGLGLIGALMAYLIFQVIPGMEEMAENVTLMTDRVGVIQKALGIPEAPVAPQ